MFDTWLESYSFQKESYIACYDKQDHTEFCFEIDAWICWPENANLQQ